MTKLTLTLGRGPRDKRALREHKPPPSHKTLLKNQEPGSLVTSYALFGCLRENVRVPSRVHVEREDGAGLNKCMSEKTAVNPSFLTLTCNVT